MTVRAAELDSVCVKTRGHVWQTSVMENVDMDWWIVSMEGQEWSVLLVTEDSSNQNLVELTAAIGHDVR